MAKKNVRDDPSKTQVTENPQMSDIVLVLDKMELLIQAVSEINKNGKYSTVPADKEHQNSFLKIDRYATFFENLLKNFWSQLKDPTHFGLFTMKEEEFDKPEVKQAIEDLTEGRKSKPTAKTVVRLLFPYRESIKTITTDNGCEFAAHIDITNKLSLKGQDKIIVYFADSYCSWQKGAIENANKLIRKYIPKKANFDDFSNLKISSIQKKLNRRPREKLNFKSPLICFFSNLS